MPVKEYKVALRVRRGRYCMGFINVHVCKRGKRKPQRRVCGLNQPPFPMWERRKRCSLLHFAWKESRPTIAASWLAELPKCDSHCSRLMVTCGWFSTIRFPDGFTKRNYENTTRYVVHSQDTRGVGVISPWVLLLKLAQKDLGSRT